MSWNQLGRRPRTVGRWRDRRVRAYIPHVPAAPSYFGRSTDYYLQLWLGLDTWYTSHPLDNNRFYRYVRMCIRQSPRKAVPGAFGEILRRAAADRQPEWPPEYREEMVARFVEDAAVIWGYERAWKIDRPPPPWLAELLAERQGPHPSGSRDRG